MSRLVLYNPNPDGSRVGDCVVRAICKATEQDWEESYIGLSIYGFIFRDMPSANHVWGAYLRKYGFSRHLVNDHDMDRYTVVDFCEDHPKGVYVLGMQGHVVCTVDGQYYDTWDCGGEIPIYFWSK